MTSTCSRRKPEGWTGEMAQLLRGHTVLPEELSWKSQILGQMAHNHLSLHLQGIQQLPLTIMGTAFTCPTPTYK